MKLQNLTVIFVIIILPIILITSLYITTGIKTIKYQSLYDTGLLTATHDAIYAFEINTVNNDYSDNAETKRNILKSSVKAFEKSLCNTCGISSYNTDEIEEYIPAIVFGMYDGFYMYAPSKSYDSQTGKTEYSHSLKNYVYYSETLDDGTIIRYTLDNYIIVSGNFGNGYEIKEGYLIDLDGSSQDGSEYKNISINNNDISAIKYYKEAYHFTYWFLEEQQIQNKTKDGVKVSYLDINDSNDPEKEDSLFVQHKREIMKDNIESVLNSSITAYSERILGQTYKMPKLSADDWEKIYSNISMLTFFQGKSIGLTKYNGYCVLNSTNSNEYVNSNLMYFTDQNGTYHDIRCEEKYTSENLKGYKIGNFEKKKIEVPKQDEEGNTIIDENGNTEYQYEYIYNHKELACYHCINDSLKTDKTVYQYIENASPEIKTAYWTSIARERYDTPKLLDTTCIITYELDGLTYSNTDLIVTYGSSYTTMITPVNSLTHRRPKEIIVIMGGNILKKDQGYKYNDVDGNIEIFRITGDVTIIAATERDTTNISFATAATVKPGDNITANIDQSYRVRVFEFIPTETATYRFWSNDPEARIPTQDPYAYLYDGEMYTVEQMDALVTQYISSKNTWTFSNSTSVRPLTYNDDIGYPNYNFSMRYRCEANHKYYLLIKTYTASYIQEFTNIYINKVS